MWDSPNRNSSPDLLHAGTGSLTDQLLALSRKVVAIEADPRLQRYLAKKYHEVRPSAVSDVNENSLSQYVGRCREVLVLKHNVPYIIACQSPKAGTYQLPL